MAATEVGCRVRRAAGFIARLKGLMLVDSISPDEGLWIRPCGAVHTFLMKFPIDLLFLDRDLRILKLCEHVRPWRPGVFCPGANSVLEFRAGFIAEHKITLKHSLEFAPDALSATTPFNVCFRLS